MSSIEKSIFRKGSTTYYFSSKFFPKEIRQDVLRLYSFVRTADDYVDKTPQNIKEFNILRGLWDEAVDDPLFDLVHHKTDSLNERVVKNMAELTRRYDFETEWTDAFLASMQADIDKQRYASLDGSLWYTYGSAEVIGLMMTKLLKLPSKAAHYAILQGRAMQWINFIRDIAEDTKLGRCYFPAEDLVRFQLENLNEKTARTNTESFGQFVEYQLDRYHCWQREAQEGFRLIPKRMRVPLETAVEMYGWTAQQIEKNPLIVYDMKVRPKRRRIVRTGIRRLV